MVQIIESRTVKSTDYVHYIVKNYWLMEGALLRNRACCFNFTPFAIFNFVAKQIIESLLVYVDATKNKYRFIHYDGRVPIARLRSDTFKTSNFEPKVWWEAILVNVVHCVMAIPSTDHEHRIAANDSCVTKSVQWLCAFGLNRFPFVSLIL